MDIPKYPGNVGVGHGDVTLPVPRQGDSLRPMSCVHSCALRVVLPFLGASFRLLMVGEEGEGQCSSREVTACALMQEQS